MFGKIKTWDNRRELKRRTTPLWSRRITWLEDGTLVKLKLETDGPYREVVADSRSAQIVWDRFKQGQSVDDCISILAAPVPTGLASKKSK